LTAPFTDSAEPAPFEEACPAFLLPRGLLARDFGFGLEAAFEPFGLLVPFDLDRLELEEPDRWDGAFFVCGIGRSFWTRWS
jgi:hypothetical protein